MERAVRDEEADEETRPRREDERQRGKGGDDAAAGDGGSAVEGQLTAQVQDAGGGEELRQRPAYRVQLPRDRDPHRVGR